MVEYSLDFDAVFGALSDGTRRDMLGRLMRTDLIISDLAQAYRLTFAAVAKHVAVLEKAGLVVKTKQGREQRLSADPAALRTTAEFLQAYETLWTSRFDRLERLLEDE